MTAPPPSRLRSLLNRPLRDWRDYGWTALRGDLFAGATVAAVAVPQAMAYALIAGVPLQYGLYTLIVQALLGAVFSSSRFLSVGPINTQSLLVAATATRLVPEAGGDQYVQLVIVLTLLKGLLQVVFAAARLGQLVRYISHSVIVGFTAGAGVLIAVGQLPAFLGIDVREAPRWLPGVPGAIQQVWRGGGGGDGRPVVVGLVAMTIVIAARGLSRRAPGPLLAIVMTGSMVALVGWTPQELLLVGELPRALPAFAVPRVWEIDWGQTEVLLGGVIAMSLLGLMEAYSVGKTLSLRSGGRISANRELFGQGATNFISGFFQCIPGSGSFSRSALNYEAGARTRLSSVFNALFAALAVLLLAGQARHVPLAALAAILFVVAYGLIDFAHFRRVARTHRHDTAVAVVTFLCTIVLPLQYAVYVGIVLNIALYLRRAGRLHMAEMVQTPGGPFIERPIHDRAGQKRVMFLQIEGDLFFAVADELHERLRGLVASGVRVIILRLKRTHSVDATVLQVMEQFTREMQSRGGHVLLCGLRPELMAALRSYGLLERIGPKNVFETGFGVFASARQALQRARRLVGTSIDTTPLDADLEKERAEALTYEI